MPFLVDSRYGNVQTIHPYPKIVGSAGDAIEKHKYRFNWDAPIHISPHDPETVYVGGNVIFKSQNRGKSWEVISPDLTTNDKSKQRSSGGTIYQDNTAAEFHCTVLYIAESPLQKGVIWAGTDDGNIQLTMDGGGSWNKLNSRIKGLPEYSWVSKIHASEHNAGTAFVVVDQHRMDDFSPYIFMTENFGKTWQKISADLPQDDYVKVVRQDPHNPDLLFAGMEHGIYASWNKGKNWEKINVDLPNVSVRDLRIQKRDRDLIVGTHGRGAYILDDIRPLEELPNAEGKEIHLFEVREAVLWNMYWRLENLGDRTYKAKNPEYGAYINFYLNQDAQEAIQIQIKDKAGNLITTLTHKQGKKGINRVVWDLGHEGAVALKNQIKEGFSYGSIRPKVIPGRYTAQISHKGTKLETEINVIGDLRIKMSTEAYKAKLEALLELRNLLSQTHQLIDQFSGVIDQLAILNEKLESNANAKSIVSTTHQELVAYKEEHLMRPPPSMNYRQRPRLREEIRSLMRAIDNTTNPPTLPQLDRIKSITEELNSHQQRMKDFEARLLEINTATASTPQIIIK